MIYLYIISGDLSNISYESNISYDRKGPVQL